jgi:succinate dehydrogenase / fumarate reductase cytochrome b subunit
MSDQRQNQERPLSPHLQIYKPQLSSMTSILHRASGAFMGVGLLLVVWGLVALADGRESYDAFLMCMGSVIGQLFLIGWTGAFFYHMCTGIRHLIRDMGYLYENKDTCWTGVVVIVMPVILTLALWGGIYGGLI